MTTTAGGLDLRIDVHVGESDERAVLGADVRAGLGASPKWLSPKWLYDDVGCALFERITTLAEYYPTRRERAILWPTAQRSPAAAGPTRWSSSAPAAPTRRACSSRPAITLSTPPAPALVYGALDRRSCTR